MHGIIVFIVVVVVVVARLRYSTMTACCIYGVQLHACMHASIYLSVYLFYGIVLSLCKLYLCV